MLGVNFGDPILNNSKSDKINKGIAKEKKSISRTE